MTNILKSLHSLITLLYFQLFNKMKEFIQNHMDLRPSNYSDHDAIFSQFTINDFFLQSENRSPINSRLFQDPFILDFESIQHFLDLETQKPLFQPKTISTQKLTQIPIIPIDLQCSQEIQNIDETLAAVTSQLSTPPSPCPSKTTQSSVLSRKRETSHSMNNMPGFLISALHSRVSHLKFQELNVLSLNNLNQISDCFYRLIDVIKHIRSKVGNRKQLRMVFNQIDQKDVNKLVKNIKIAKSQEKYVTITHTYPNQILNEAKLTLRTLIAQSMTSQWIYEYARTRQFTNNQKRETFQKYLAYFRMELQEGNVRQFVNRKQVLSMDPFQQRKVKSTESFHATSMMCLDEVKLNKTLRYEGISENASETFNLMQKHKH